MKQAFSFCIAMPCTALFLACGRSEPDDSILRLEETLRSTVLPCAAGPRGCDFYDKQWDMSNKLKVNPWGIPITTPGDIHIEPIWNEGKMGDKAVIVAVIDTGVDRHHPDLEDNIFTNSAEIPGNGIDDDGNGFVDDVHGWNFVTDSAEVDDPVGHGTHVAGVIGARRDNNFGIRGVNNHVSILPIVYLDGKAQGNTTNAVKAIHYAVDMGAKVINASWGGGRPDALREAILWAESKGVLCIFSSGNDGENLDVYPYYPPSFQLPNTIVVGSSTFDDGVTGDSNWGRRTVDILAPGVEILSTLPDQQYGYMSGTSMAAPHVSGAAALLWAEHPDWTYQKVKQTILLSSRLRSDYRNRVREGRLDMTAMMHEDLHPGIMLDGLWQTKVDGRALSYAKAGIYSVPLRVPGARYIRIQLQPLTMEHGRQRVVIEDGRGYTLERFTDSADLVLSEYVMGEELILKFIVDRDGEPLRTEITALEFIKDQ